MDVLWLQNSMPAFVEILRCILCCSDEDYHETERDYWETNSLLGTDVHWLQNSMSVFVKILRCILCCSDDDCHETERDSWERNSLLGASNRNSSVRNSSCTNHDLLRQHDHNSSVKNSSNRNTSLRSSSCSNHDLLRQHDPSKIYYYECYPNVSIGKPTTKQHNAMLQQSEYVNPPASSHKMLPSPSKSSPSLDGSSKSPNEPTPPSLKAPSSSNPALSPLPTDSANQQTKGNQISFPKGTSPVYYSTPKPEVLKKSTSPSSQKTISSSKPTLSPLPSYSTKQQPKENDIRVQNGTSPASMPPKNNENLMKKGVVLDVPSFPLFHKAPSSSKPMLSSLPSASTDQQKKASSSLSNPAPSALSQSLSSSKPPSFNSEQHQLPPKPPASPSPRKSSQSLSGSTLTMKDAVPKDLRKPLSQKAPSSSQPTLSPLPPDSKYQQENDCYILVKKGASTYKIPKDIEDLIEKDIVPDVLKKPLSPSTYKDYFAALLYAEDFYYEKWSSFQLLNVTLELREATIYDKSLKNKHSKKRDKKDVRFFVAFEIDSPPRERPFLLSRDFVYAQCSGGISRKFQGILYRVVKSTTVLVEFEKDFYSQHQPSRKYDISFSFNRVCLKRAHQSIAAASDHLFQNCLFPDYACRQHIPLSEPHFYGNCKLDLDGNSAVRQILSLRGQPPYLVEGPLCVTRKKKELPDEDEFDHVLSKTGNVVREAGLQICQRSPNSRILICAPSNRTCDELMESLMKVIPESDMFRANAAFRKMYEVTDDIFQVSLVEGECFSCPPLEELRQYRVISSTFASSFRLHNVGITAGHFTHIFLVDASSTIEPDALIVLSNLANENTTVVVSGASYDHPHWIRSDIARKNGLEMSYFERLCMSEAYRSCNPMFYMRLSTST